MLELITTLLICLDLSKTEAINGLILRHHMEQNCEVVSFTQGKGRQGKKPWINATLDCKCKGKLK